MGISCEKSRFYAKKSYLFPILGGAPGARPLDPSLGALKKVRPAGGGRENFWGYVLRNHLSSNLGPEDFFSPILSIKCALATQGWFQGCAPPNIGKNNIFWRKIVIFHTKNPKNVPASLRSAQLF
jgi:hypothetical protein